MTKDATTLVVNLLYNKKCYYNFISFLSVNYLYLKVIRSSSKSLSVFQVPGYKCTTIRGSCCYNKTIGRSERGGVRRQEEGHIVLLVVVVNVATSTLKEKEKQIVFCSKVFLYSVFRCRFLMEDKYSINYWYVWAFSNHYPGWESEHDTQESTMLLLL